MSVNIDHQKNSISPSTTTLDIDTTGSLVLPKGSTAQRYPAATEGALELIQKHLDNLIQKFSLTADGLKLYKYLKHLVQVIL